MKNERIIFIAVLSIIIFFIVGVINLDGEFGEERHLFIKIPPTYEFYFGYPPLGINEVENEEQYKMVSEFDKRLKSFELMGLSGEALAFCLIELLLVAIFIKPVFSKKTKFILIDIALFATAAFVSLFCFAAWNITSTGVVKLIIVALLAHYVILRLLRPVRKYKEITL